MVSGLLQGTLGLLGGPGHLFLHCGPLVLAPSLIVAGLSAHREVALFCSSHWSLALLYVSPEKHVVVTSGCAGLGEGRAASPTRFSSDLSRNNTSYIWNPGLLLDSFALLDFHTVSC